MQAPAETYTTISNIWDPFRVIISGEIVTVYRFDRYEPDKNGEPDDNRPVFHADPLETFRSLKTFVGRDPECPKYDGSAFILQISKNKYVFISSLKGIYSFETDDEIMEFHSPIGNGAWPYPHATGRKWKYLLLDCRKIKVVDDVEDSMGNPYDAYYDLSRSNKRADKRRVSEIYPTYTFTQIRTGTR